MTNQEAIVYLEGQFDCMCSEDCQIYTGHKDCPQGFICTDGQALLTAISALQEREAKAQLSAEGTTFDLISRQAAIEVIEEMQMPIMRSMFPEEQFVFKGMSEALSAIKDLPSEHSEIEERKEESAQNVPKEDLISRKAAIDAECEVCQIAPKKERGHNCTYYVHGCKEIECLRELPSAESEPQWIAVSERLPEEGQGCLVCDNGSITIDTFIGRGNPYNWKWYIRDYEAWMPLPEPYRAERRTDDGD